MAAQPEHPSVIQAGWIRRVRSNARHWASEWMPDNDLTLMSDAKDMMFAWMLEEDEKSITMAFATPLYAPVCMWSIVRVDVKDVLEKRGYVIYPSRLDVERGNGPRNTRWIIARKPHKGDDKEYIGLVRDGTLLKRQQIERMAENAMSRIRTLNDQIAEYEVWMKSSRARRARV